MHNPAQHDTRWTFPPAFRAAVTSVPHRKTRDVFTLAMDRSQFPVGIRMQVPGDALLPSEHALDKMRELYMRHKEDVPALPWDEAITLVLTNLQPVDYTEFMKGFRQ